MMVIMPWLRKKMIFLGWGRRWSSLASVQFNFAFLCILKGCAATSTLQLWHELDREDKKKPLNWVPSLSFLFRNSLYHQREYYAIICITCAAILAPFLILHLFGEFLPSPSSFTSPILRSWFCILLSSALVPPLTSRFIWPRPCFQGVAISSKPLDPDCFHGLELGWVCGITPLKSSSCVHIRPNSQIYTIPRDKIEKRDAQAHMHAQRERDLNWEVSHVEPFVDRVRLTIL